MLISAERPYAANMPLRLLLVALSVLGLTALTAILLGVGRIELGLMFVAGIALAVAIVRGGIRVFWAFLIFLLFGYMFLSRGFAGIGAAPLYVGEIGLMIGVACLVLFPFANKARGLYLRRFLRIEILLLAIFLILQIVQTVPYISRYQFDALRDAATYLYAIFALLICLFIPRGWVSRFFGRYASVIPYVLLWFPVLFFAARLNLFEAVRLPGATSPLLYTKGSDVGVHLAGIGAFMLLGLDRVGRPWRTRTYWFCWTIWLLNLLAFGAFGRAILLTATPLALIPIFNLRSYWYRPLVVLVLALWLLVLSNDTARLEIDFGLERTISVEQLVNNVTSIFSSGSTRSELAGTSQWRLRWWDEIVQYTFEGRYFWTGKGYGVNLANDDGFQVQEDESLRSPHNGHMTILARGGVPSFIVWVLFVASVIFGLLRYYLVRAAHQPQQAKIALWLLVYILANIIMTGFDVYLEGPMGGIWFWSLIGFALVYTSTSTEPASEPERTSTALPPTT